MERRNGRIVASDDAGGWRPAWSADGSPLFPIRNEGERTALAEAAGFFGIELEWVEEGASASSPLPSPTASGSVVALGEAVAEEARLYAHLTGRKSVCLAEETPPQDIPADAQVIIGDSERVCVDFIDPLHRGSPRQVAPGLLFAPDGERLRRLVLINALVFHAGLGGGDGRQASLLPFYPLRRSRHGDHEIFGEADAEGSLAAVGAGHELLTMLTHSDGIDTKLQNRVICSMPGALRRESSSRAPLCARSGRCSFEDQENIGVVPLAEIRCRAMVLLSCGVLFPKKGLLAPEWGIGQGLLQSPTVGPLITTTGICMSSPWHLERLLELLYSGRSLGEAVATFNRWTLARHTNHLVCILGDPALTLPATRLEKVPWLELLERDSPTVTAADARGGILEAVLSGMHHDLTTRHVVETTYLREER